jgi:hypothetical protein
VARLPHRRWVEMSRAGAGVARNISYATGKKIKRNLRLSVRASARPAEANNADDTARYVVAACFILKKDT